MKEIIVKREDDSDLSLEIIENEFLRVSIRECGEGIQFMDFTLSEIDDLQEAISIMKERLQRKTFVYLFPDGFTDRETLEKLTGLTIIATNTKTE